MNSMLRWFGPLYNNFNIILYIKNIYFNMYLQFALSVTLFRYGLGSFREFLVIGGYRSGSFLLCFISLNLIGWDKLSLARLRYFSFSLLETHRSVFSTLPPLSALSRFKKYKKSLKLNFLDILNREIIIREAISLSCQYI